MTLATWNPFARRARPAEPLHAGAGATATPREDFATRATLPAVPSEFHLVFLLFQRFEAVYSLGLAALSAYARRKIPSLRVHYVPVFPKDAPRDLAAIARDLSPSLIAVSAMSPTWLPLIPHLEELKRQAPAVPVVVGGYQAIVDPAETLREPCVDYVCAGDGEQALVDLIRRIVGERPACAPIAGLWEKQPNGDPIRSPPVLAQDLSDFPFPDYSLFERDGALDYLKPNAVESKRFTSVPVISGRGCPYRCTYCTNTTLLALHGGKGGLLRKFKIGPLVEELAALGARYGIEFFQFWDEEFLYDARYGRELLAAFRQEVGLPFSMFVRVENMSDELCRMAAAAGCHSMWFGVESGSEEYRRQYLNRPMSNRRILEAAAAARRHGIKRFIFSMVGMPFESRADAARTLDLCREINPELTVFSQFLPLPGTPLYELCRTRDLLLERSLERQMWPLGSLNLREHADGMSAREMAALADEIMAYLAATNRCDP